MTEESTPPPVVTIRASRAKLVLRLVLCALFVSVACWAYAAAPDVRWIIVVGGAFFALSGLVHLLGLVRPPTMIISETGIEQDFVWTRWFWPWTSIDGVSNIPVPLYGGVFVRRRGRLLPVRLVGWAISSHNLESHLVRFRTAATIDLFD